MEHHLLQRRSTSNACREVSIRGAAIREIVARPQPIQELPAGHRRPAFLFFAESSRRTARPTFKKPNVGHPVFPLPGASHVDVVSAENAVQIRVPIVAVTSVGEDESGFEVTVEEVVGLGLTDPLRNEDLRNLRGAEL